MSTICYISDTVALYVIYELMLFVVCYTGGLFNSIANLGNIWKIEMYHNTKYIKGIQR